MRILSAVLFALMLSGLLAQAHAPVERRHPHEAESHKPHDAIARHPHEAASHPKPKKAPQHGKATKGTHPKVAKH